RPSLAAAFLGDRRVIAFEELAVFRHEVLARISIHLEALRFRQVAPDVLEAVGLIARLVLAGAAATGVLAAALAGWLAIAGARLVALGKVLGGLFLAAAGLIVLLGRRRAAAVLLLLLLPLELLQERIHVLDDVFVDLASAFAWIFVFQTA